MERIDEYRIPYNSKCVAFCHIYAQIDLLSSERGGSCKSEYFLFEDIRIKRLLLTRDITARVVGPLQKSALLSCW